jgi:uncharacterized protein Usg
MINQEDIKEAFLWVKENQKYAFTDQDLMDLNQLTEESTFNEMMNWLTNREHILHCVRYRHQEIMKRKS